MVSDRIRDYVEKTRKSGFTDEQIASTLKNAGWPDSEIEDALKPKALMDMPPAPQKKSEDITDQKTKVADKAQKINVLAIISLVLSFIIPFIALILGILALKEIKRSGEKGRGLATAAIIISIIGIILLLILILAIPFMAYFGVMNPAKLLPEKCQSTPGLDCLDKAVIDKDSATFALRNTLGDNINIKDVTLSSKSCNIKEVSIGNDASFVAIAENLVGNNEVLRIRLSGCNNGKSGDRYEEDATVLYFNAAAGIENTATISIRSKVI